MEGVPDLNCVRIVGARFFDVGRDDVVWVTGTEGTGRTGRRQGNRRREEDKVVE